MPSVRTLSRWLAVGAATAALTGAAVGCGGPDQPGGSSSTSTQRVDNRPGGTPNEHVDKPGESK